MFKRIFNKLMLEFSPKPIHLKMNELLKKLNFKDHKQILVINAPDEVCSQVREISMYTKIDRKIGEDHYKFAILFTYKQDEIKELFDQVKNNLKEDAILWFAYPKKSSEKYDADISRDASWTYLEKNEYNGVQMISIDDDWSALRFRQAKFIKKD